MRTFRLKLVLLLRSVPSRRHQASRAAGRFGLIERFTPYVSGGRAPSEAPRQGSGWKGDETRPIAELTLAVATIAMLTAIVPAVRS